MALPKPAWLIKGLPAGLLIAAAASVAATPEGVDLEVGRHIYMDGVHADGKPLAGSRWDNIVVSGHQAACVLCHRPSGMGTVEGDLLVPPITGHALFGTDTVVATMDPRSGKFFNQAHQPYTEESLARAMREGTHIGGQAMDVMMPRYALDESEMKSLIAYLRQLSAEWSPGVTKDEVRLATVITPEVPAQRRTVFVDMMRTAVMQKNGSTMLAGRPTTRHHMAGAAEMVLGTERKWSLDVWELQGPPENWAGQLDEFYRRQPVFALVSGLGSGDWRPVGEFCDHHQVPCWFPSVDLPPSDSPGYSLYFSRGTALEAQVLAAYLHRADAQTTKRVIQVRSEDYAGAGGARTLQSALAGLGIALEVRVLHSTDAAALQQTLSGIGASDALVLWLRPAEIALLDKIAPPPTAQTYFSAQMSEPDHTPFPAAWKRSLHLVYPYELPDRRKANLAYFRAWLTQRRIPLIDETMQSEVYFALAFLTDSITEILDNMYRDYLIERAENMISRRESGKAEAEVFASTMGIKKSKVEAETIAVQSVHPTPVRQAGMAPGKREGTTAYPRLGLGPGQRFASKGGYIAHFAEGGDTLVADTDWIVP